MLGPTTHWISKTYYQMFQLSVIVLDLCPRLESSVVWSMTICWMLDEPSFRRHLNSSIFCTKF